MAEENPFARLFTQSAPSRANATEAAIVSGSQLATLWPGAQDEPLKLFLYDADLSDTSYSCVSYDRSTEAETVEIEVDEQKQSIPKSLESALRALRRQDGPRTLWADLLIGSTVEQRSRQGTAMKAVVEGADEVIAWLDPGSSITPKAFDTIKLMSSWWTQARAESGFPENMARATATQMMSARDRMLSRSIDELEPSNTSLWDAIRAIYSSSYFSSIQSIPEIVLAKKTLVTVGSASISWQDFVSAQRGLVILMPNKLDMQIDQAMMETFQQVGSIDIACRRRREGESIELLPMIQSSRDCSFSDPREAVFSMIPISTPSKRIECTGGKKQPLPSIDYSKSAQEVFQEAATYIINERQDLMLWWAERPPCARGMANMPSWVPDWSTPLGKDVIKPIPNNSGLRAWSDTVQPQKRITITGDTLHVQAHALDKVVSVSPMFDENNYRRLCLREWQALPQIPDESLEDKIAKIWRALVLDTDAGFGETMRSNAKPPKEMWISFQSVLAEERILELLKCSVEDFATKPELQARARSDPQMSILGPQTGKSQQFEALLRRNAMGRKFFQTESGRCGMTAVEEVPRKAGEPEIRELSFDNVLGSGNFIDDMFRQMNTRFESYVEQRDPNAARALREAMKAGQRRRPPGGVAPGDVVVAMVGGFVPYVLRPIDNSGQQPESANNAPTSLESVSRYKYIGDCYLHGVMDAEPFKVKGWFGRESWKPDVGIVDITIE